MSRRTEQVARLLTHIIGDIVLKELSDPRLSGLVTITGAKVAPDLRTATIYFSVLGDEADWTAATEALNGAAGFIQRLLAKRIVLKVTPKLSFVPDRTMEKAQRIEQILIDLPREED